MESLWPALEAEVLLFFGLAFLIFQLIKKCFAFREEPTIIHHPNHPVWDLVKYAEAFTRGYSPTVWLCFGSKYFVGSMLSIVHTFIREARDQPIIDYEREMFSLSDGGTVGLDWARSSLDPDTSLVYHSPNRDDESVPILFFHHGLCGCSRSQYIRSLTNKFLRTQKYRVVCLVARGCGNVPLSTPEGFIAARTLDMRESLEYIHHKYPNSLVYGLGFSLGGGIMAKYIGEEGSNCKLGGAIVVSSCWDYLERSPWFKIWSKFFLASNLINYTKKNLKMFKKNMLIDLDSALDADCVEIYDRHIIVPTQGYESIQEYYQKSSPLPVADKISIPTLSLNSKDDPVCSINGCPDSPSEMGPGLVVIKTQRGGHVAWPEGMGAHSSWMDDVVFSWIEGCNDYQQRVKDSQPPATLRIEKGHVISVVPKKEHEKTLISTNAPIIESEVLYQKILELIKLSLKSESIGLVLLGYSALRIITSLVRIVLGLLMKKFAIKKILSST